MPAEVMEKLICDGSCGIELRMVLQAAPVLKGRKVSNMVCMNDRELSVVCEKLQGSGVSLMVLCSFRGRHLVLVFRRGALEVHLRKEECRSFLRIYGYRGEELHLLLLRLHRRFSGFYEKKTVFPHEIGVFLGYPVCDIKGFLRNKGEGFLYSGYWKVYQDAEGAKALFLAFDQAREEALEEYMAGKGLLGIAC